MTAFFGTVIQMMDQSGYGAKECVSAGILSINIAR